MTTQPVYRRRAARVATLSCLMLVAIPGWSGIARAADTVPPGPVTSFVAKGGSGQISLSWVNPTAADLAGVLLVRKVGTTAPASSTDGTQVARVAKPAKIYTDKLLDAATSYSYAAYAYDTSGNLAKPAKATAQTALTPPAVVHLSGTLTADVTLTPKKAKLFLIDDTLTVPAGRVLTLGAGVKIKARYGIQVAGGLRSTGISTARALVTSIYDDTVGGDTANTVGTPQDNPFTIDVLRSGGTVALDWADLRYGTLIGDADANGSAAVAVTNSLLRDAKAEFHNGTTVRLQANTFTRSSLYMTALDTPVLSGNSFVDGAPLGFGDVPKSPFWASDIGDLTGIGANTATGTAPQRVFVFNNCHVRSTWTLGPASGYIYGLGLYGVTVDPGATLTLGAGSLTKAVGDINVSGTLRSTGTATSPALVTSLYDDSVGGDTDGTTGTPAAYPFSLSVLRSGGTVALDRAELRYGTLIGDADANGSAAVAVTNSLLRDAKAEFHNGTTVRLQANTFTRSSLYMTALDTPVLSGNSFVDGAPLGFGYVPQSPFWASDIADLTGIGANTATGTAPQRLFQFVDSHVRTRWTINPATTHLYALAGITVDAGATLTTSSGAITKNPGAITVDSGGTLTASGATFSALQGQSWPGISVRPGGTASISNSDFSGAAVALEANYGFAPGMEPAHVSATQSTFSGNAMDIYNTFKDLPGSEAVDAAGSSAAHVSAHTHECMPPPDSGLPWITRTLWDVEGTVGRSDSPECPSTYTELKGHP